jgi:hypothetical protein
MNVYEGKTKDKFDILLCDYGKDKVIAIEGFTHPKIMITSELKIDGLHQANSQRELVFKTNLFSYIFEKFDKNKFENK